MLQITPQMKIQVAVEPADFRNYVELCIIARELTGWCGSAKTLLGRIRSPGRCSSFVIVAVPRSKRSCTTARVSGCVTNVSLKDDSAGGHPRRTRTAEQRPSPLINCRFCFPPAIRIARRQHRTGVRSAHAIDVRDVPQADTSCRSETLRCRSAKIGATEVERKRNCS